MAIVISDIAHTQGTNNKAGVGIYVYVVPHEDVLTFPTTTANPTTFAADVTITDAIVLKTDKKFIKMYLTLETGSLASNMVGERDGKSHEAMLKFNYPTNKKDIVGFVKYFANTPVVAIVTEIEGGQMRVLGCDPQIPAYLEAAEITTGEKIADKKGATITIKHMGDVPPIYEGTIDITGV